MKTHGFLLALALILGTPAIAAAQPAASDPASDADRGVARQLTLKGLDALDRKDFATAEVSFARAALILWAPTIGLGLARARAGLGKLVGAQEAYSRVAHTTVPADASAAFKEAIASATHELEQLSPRVPSLTIYVKGPTAPEVTVDGVAVAAGALGLPRPADPGQHVIRARAPGFAPTEATVTLAERRTERVDLELKAGTDGPMEAPTPTAAQGPTAAASSGLAPPPGSRPSGWSTQRRAGAVTAGAGVLGLAVGGIFVGLTAGAKSTLLSECPSNLCSTQQAKNDHASANTDALVSTIGLSVGGAALATGALLYFLSGDSSAPKDEAPKAARLLPTFGPRGVGLVGSF